jgi:hypothetical protein
MCCGPARNLNKLLAVRTFAPGVSSGVASVGTFLASGFGVEIVGTIQFRFEWAGGQIDIELGPGCITDARITTPAPGRPMPTPRHTTNQSAQHCSESHHPERQSRCWLRRRPPTPCTFRIGVEIAMLPPCSNGIAEADLDLCALILSVNDGRFTAVTEPRMVCRERYCTVDADVIAHRQPDLVTGRAVAEFRGVLRSSMILVPADEDQSGPGCVNVLGGGLPSDTREVTALAQSLKRFCAPRASWTEWKLAWNKW